MKYQLILLFSLIYYNSLGQVNLIKDIDFKSGFDVFMVEDGVPNLPLTIRKKIIIDSSIQKKPDWQLAQWNNYNNKMENASYSVKNGSHVYKTKEGNEFVINPSEKMVKLSLNTSSEYGKNQVSPDNPRKDGQKWPHLLISQSFDNQSAQVSSSNSISMSVNYCINSIKNNHKKETLNKGLHSAQFQWFISVNNQNENSKGLGDYFWFGFSLYDFRYSFTPYYASMDTNTTGKFIYMPDMKGILGENNETKIGKSKVFFSEIKGQLKQAFLIAKENGFLKDTNWEDLYIGHTNIGWEVPGSFDVSATISDLEIVVN